MTSKPERSPPAGSAQLTFDLALRPSLEAGDFLVSDANAAAVTFLDRWPDWPSPSALLAGPAASGKSHLGKVWQQRSGAIAFSASSIGESAVKTFLRPDMRALLIEDIDRGIGDERVVFHLLNQARETHRHLLMTSRIPPGELEIALPDLRSRVRALAVLQLAEVADPELIRAACHNRDVRPLAGPRGCA